MRELLGSKKQCGVDIVRECSSWRSLRCDAFSYWPSYWLKNETIMMLLDHTLLGYIRWLSLQIGLDVVVRVVMREFSGTAHIEGRKRK